MTPKAATGAPSRVTINTRSAFAVQIASGTRGSSFRWIWRDARVTILGVIRFALYAVYLAALSGCVIGRATRPSLNESAQGPLAAPVTGSPVVPQTSPEDGDAPPDKAKPGATWVRGYWHWDGIRYVWQRGRYQDDAAAESAKPTPAARAQ